MTEIALDAASQLFEFDPELVACPYPTFAAMREHAVVAWYDELEAFAVTGYDLILEVLRRPDLFSSRSATGPAGDRRAMELALEVAADDPDFASVAKTVAKGSSPVLLTADPPAHPRQRALVNRSFTPGAIRRMEPEMENVARGLVEGFAGRGRVELIREFAVPFPMTVIATAVGVSLDRMDDFMRWSKSIVAGIGKPRIEKDDVALMIRTRSELVSYLMPLLAERAEDPQEDLISQLLAAEIDGERLTKTEVVSMVIQFMLAGNHTTATLIGHAMHRLADDPDEADHLRRDPGRIAPFIEEVLRTTPPINGTYRVATEDCELGGVRIPSGAALWLVYASGNRDVEHFAEPDVFRCPQPSKSSHLAFGFGEHFCLGAALARAEGRIALEMLLSHCDEIRLDIGRQNVQFEPSFMLHSIQALPLVFTSGRV